MLKNVKHVEEFIDCHAEWREILQLLRSYLLEAGLEEAVKWNMPAYLLNGKTIIGLGAFKGYAGVWFHQGSFLSDSDKVLINAQSGKTRGLRQWRFTDKKQIKKKQFLNYVYEAIENAKQGLEIKPIKKKRKVVVPDIIKEVFKKNKVAASSFQKLTERQQYEYCQYIHDAKREATKLNRMEKIIPMIENGVPLSTLWK